METNMPGRLEFDVSFSTATQGKRRRSESSPMQILLMGDFSGISAGTPGFPVHALDLDNFDTLMAKLKPRLALTLGTSPSQRIDIEFNGLDDFHPDALFERLPLFQHLRTLRANLSNPATFEQAAAQLSLADVEAAPGAEKTEEISISAVPTEQDTNPLDELLSGRPASIASEPTAVKSSKSVDISAFIRNAVAPHIESGPHPQRDSYIASVDKTISELMRSILHHPQFQALEAVWRSANECLARLELDESLRLYILDASKEQLQQDLQQLSQDLSASLLYQSLVEQSVQTLGGESWSLLIGLYSFTAQNQGDIQCLKAMAQLARQAGGPFVAAAHAALLGCDPQVALFEPRQWQALNEQDQKAWSELRDQSYAHWLGLVFPRFLLRLPYGANAEEIDRFEFEEIPTELTEQQRHECYLWGNAAVAIAVLLGQSYQLNSWSMQPGDVLEVDDLPWHVYEVDGEKTIKPCAEALMSERAAEHIESYGIMPLMSYKNKNAVRLWRFRSLAKQNAALAGPWTD
jgi:type VI secretion system protein ImpC